MEAGNLSNRVSVQEPVSVPDGYGGKTVTWTNYLDIWAMIEPLKGRALYYAQQIDEKVDARIVVRYSAAGAKNTSLIQPGWRIVQNGIVYRISAIVDPDMRKEVLELTCETLRDERIAATVTKPSIVSPIEEATDVALNEIAITSAFAVTGGSDTHRSTQWQITAGEDTAFETCIFDIISTTELTALSLASVGLENAHNYNIRARHTGLKSGSSAWSDTVNFTTVEA
jgi:SPP1 family predicted phage head-tail adaptor